MLIINERKDMVRDASVKIQDMRVLDVLDLRDIEVPFKMVGGNRNRVYKLKLLCKIKYANKAH